MSVDDIGLQESEMEKNCLRFMEGSRAPDLVGLLVICGGPSWKLACSSRLSLCCRKDTSVALQVLPAESIHMPLSASSLNAKYSSHLPTINSQILSPAACCAERTIVSGSSRLVHQVAGLV